MVKSIIRNYFLLNLVVLLAACGDLHHANPALSESQLRLQSLQKRLDQEARSIMHFWLEHGPDEKYGGFHATLDRQGKAIEPWDKGLIQQSRHLWSLSAWYERREQTDRVSGLAHRSFEFLFRQMLDDDGEFYYKVSREGAVVDKKKQIYAESFAIYALSEYARVFSNQKAAQLALNCFRSVDRRTHDKINGGYDQSNDPGWLATGAEKGTNTHIHLLESFTALYRTTGDELVKERLLELVDLVANKIVQPAGYAHKEFLKNWQPFAEPLVSYGHDLETVWLLMDALEALNKEDDQKIKARIKKMGRNSAFWGYDSVKGGYYEEGIPAGQVTRFDKLWWVQGEALPGLWQLYRLTGDSTYLDKMEGTMSWIEQYQKDQDFGDWYWGIDRNGNLDVHGSDKGSEWKTSYHTLRALIFTSDWINETLM